MEITADLTGVEKQIAELQRSRLRRYREDAGLTQQEVADRLGVSKMTVSKWEAANDPGDHWLELSKLYEVREAYPSAPFNPEKRLKWCEGRSHMFASRAA